MNKILNCFTDKNSLIRRKFTLANIQSILGRTILFVLLLGLAYLILFPLLTKVSSAFMSESDIYDETVRLIPAHPTWDNFLTVIKENQFIKGLANTFVLALLVAILSTASSTLVAYGLARFKFKGQGIMLVLVLFTVLVPMQTTLLPMFAEFKYFDIFGIFKAILGAPLKTTDTAFPMLFLASTCLGFRNGLYVLLLRQFFIGVPEELSEAAHVDGAGHFRTFAQIILPLAKPMMLVVFIFAFCWQWTDVYYSNILYSEIKLLPNIVIMLGSITPGAGTSEFYASILQNTGAILSLLPLIVLFIFVQKKLVQGIERSCIVG